MDPVITLVEEQDTTSNEESLIEKDSNVFDTEITISPISVSRANLSDNVGKQIPSLEVVQTGIVPYTIKVTFPFP
jgi:hypothetical protein